ncbi:GNAT family N-acetyltransferase [Leucobacter denitrificans]|uniref:N-acetyltransferase n=1 Tax=Leucobacter denitrificans TaxID=683042 RepID=A0A7G9S6F3_9MICO|nr:GNAT family N-acetyltransferase [Leucobacter denitrificans]QNN63428.1 N-acetyltransferase [Leucobacter denitrificans]
MANYSDEEAALADGIQIVHEPDASRFAVYQQQDEARSLVGEAHYSLRRSGKVDFDHTLIIPRLRGTGLSNLLAQHALTSDVAKSNEITASCWFIAQYLARNPELAH